MRFTIEKKMNGSLGRAGVLETPHGVIETPAFVTVGTRGTVKGLTPEQVLACGAQVVLANTYHLYLDPGDEIVKKAGGLQTYMNWSGPTMTDSGGFQVFSLGAAYGKNISKITKQKLQKNGEAEELLISEAQEDKDRPKIVEIDHDGVMFRSHINGDAHYITPEKSIEIQHNLGADIIFAFDECTSPNEPLHYQKEALDRTHRWAKRSLDFHTSKSNAKTQALFGIVQGGRHEELRKESATTISKMDFDGFGIGGSFSKDDMSAAVGWVNAVLPEEKPRHLLGIGEPEDLFMAVESGCDLFDCVNPTRLGRNGTIYTSRGKIHITNAEFTKDFSPIESGCACYACKNYSKAYISHLFKSKEMLGGVLASIHNLHFIIHLVSGMRQAILNDTFSELKNKFLARF